MEPSNAGPPRDAPSTGGDAPLDDESHSTIRAVESAMQWPIDPAVVDLADDQVRHLDPNFVRVERLVGWIIVGAATIGIGVGLTIVFVRADALSLLHGLLALAGMLVVAGLIWGAHFWPPIDHRYRSYRLNDRRIEIRKGVLWRKVLDVPRSRVQHTDVNQGPLERRYGLAHLVIHTAGTTSANVTLEGLSHETAVRIRDHLVKSGRGDAV